MARRVRAFTFAMTDWNRGLIEDFRAHGKVTKGFFAGRDVLLLTTKGAKSGVERTSPVAFSRDGDCLVIAASKGGASENPGWYHNLKADPIVTVEVGGERFAARANIVKPESERRRLYDRHAAHHSGLGFREYEKKTTRRIPVITLERVGPSAG